MHVSDDDSNMFCKFDEIRWILNKCWNFMIFLGPALSVFCSVKKLNFTEWAGISLACFWWWFPYVLQVWWNLVNFEKMLKFHILKGRQCKHFQWKNLTSLNRRKFHMHVSDDDSNMFCKFDEIWWTTKKCWNFMIFVGRHCRHFSLKKFNFSEWAGISHACVWWWFQ